MKSIRIDDTEYTMQEVAPKPRVPELVWDRGTQTWYSPELYQQLKHGPEQQPKYHYGRSSQDYYESMLYANLKAYVPGFTEFDKWF